MGKTQVFVGAVLFICLVAGLGVYASRDGNRDNAEPFVARVGDQTISPARFLNEYRNHLGRTGQHDSPRLRRYFLDGLINKKLFVFQAREQGVAEGPEFEFAVDRIRSKLLIDAYTAYVIYEGASVDENDLLDMFARMNTQLKARHLYARTYEAAQRLSERLQNGESFEDLAREVFQDSTLAHSGGSVGYFGFDEMDPAFENAAYSLKPGEISPPVRTAQGYSIIQLEDRFLHPLLTETEFASRKDRVQRYATVRKRFDSRKQHVRQILKELDVRIDEVTLEKLWRRIRQDRAPFDFDEENLLNVTLISFTDADRRIEWTVSDFREAAVFVPEEQRAAITGLDAFTQFLEGLIVREEMIRRADALSMHDEPLFVETMEAAVDDWIYEAYRKRFAGSVVVPEDSVGGYFDRFGHEFTVPERRLVREVLVDNRSLAEEILQRSKETPFERLAAEYSIRPGSRPAGGSLGYVARDQLGVLAESVFGAAEDEVLGPFEIQGRYAVLKVGERLPARPAGLEEVRGEIRERLRTVHEQRLLRDEVSGLKTKFTVLVADSVLYSIPLSN
ncbi:MAG TPA: peptidylprolyl isomerase [Rhodothermales bacterium]|nr:peptidylprolyl isomerase [Rhodothermales bacterium]